MSNWEKQLKNCYTSPKKLPNSIKISVQEEKFFKKVNIQEHLSFQVTPYYFSLANPQDNNDPIRKQFMPTAKEFIFHEYELKDPLAENEYIVSPGLIHRYPDRVVLRLTTRCAVHCRYCYRRFAIDKASCELNEKDIEQALLYIDKHPEVEEILVSGGDPLILNDNKILSILRKIRQQRKDIVIRVGTRIPVVLPQRITKNLVHGLAKLKPLWIITQFNHPLEITPLSIKAISRLIDNGIPVLNQAVLLKGVNDNIEIMTLLLHILVKHRIKAYYLFQTDLVKGTSHFRTDIKKGLQIMRQLSSKISGLSMPVYALDLPGGGGKVPLTKDYIKQVKAGWYYIENYQGTIYKYPQESFR